MELIWLNKLGTTRFEGVTRVDYFDFFWMVYWMTLYAMMVAWLGLMSAMAICLARSKRHATQPKESEDRALQHEGVTTTMPQSVLFAQESGEEPQRTVTFVISEMPRPLGMDMPLGMMEQYDTPIAVSAALQEDIRRLLEMFETK